MLRVGVAIFIFALLTQMANAHVVSVSTGEIRITGRVATYELHIPVYEMERVDHPEVVLLNEIALEGGRRITSECSRNGDDYVCKALYEFDHELPDKLDVDCTLFRVTVPNHVHMLYALQGSNRDQVVFDQTTTHRAVRFHPETWTEAIVRDGSAGAKQLLGSVSTLLFLVAIAVAARDNVEASSLAVLFLAAEWLARPIAALVPLALSPSFLESLLALTVGYLAAEIVFLPKGRGRWLVVPLFGLVHGLPFAVFPALYLGGAAAVQVILLAVLILVTFKMPIARRRPLAGALLVAACCRFARLLMA